MERISVVIPTFNRATTVCEAVESVLAQERKADEIIVVDDGSTDDTLYRLKKYCCAIEVIAQENKGVSAARNAGAEAASFEWITFLDSDDIWHPNRLSILQRDIGNSDAGVHIANAIFVGRGYEKELFQLRKLNFPRERAKFLLGGLNVALAYPQIDAVAIRKDWIDALGGFDTAMTIHEDTHLLCRLSLLGPWLVTSEVVAEVRRIREDGTALSDQTRHQKVYAATMKVKIFDDLMQLSALTPAQRDAVSRRLSGALFELAGTQLDVCARVDSHRTLMRSARAHPSPKGWIKVLPPLLLGRSGYEAVLRNRGGFYRSEANS